MNKYLIIASILLFTIYGCKRKDQEKSIESKNKSIAVSATPTPRGSLTMPSIETRSESFEVNGTAYRSEYPLHGPNEPGIPTYEVNLIIRNCSSLSILIDRIEGEWVIPGGKSYSFTTKPVEQYGNLVSGSTKEFWHNPGANCQFILSKGKPIQYSINIYYGNSQKEVIAELPYLNDLPYISRDDRDDLAAGISTSRPKGVPLTFRERVQLPDDVGKELIMENNPSLTGVFIDRSIRIVPTMLDERAIYDWCKRKEIPDGYWRIYEKAHMKFIFYSGEASTPRSNLVDKIEPTLAEDDFVKEYEKLYVVIFADFVFDKSKYFSAFPPEKRIDTSEYGCVFMFKTREEAEKAVNAFLTERKPKK